MKKLSTFLLTTIILLTACGGGEISEPAEIFQTSKEPIITTAATLVTTTMPEEEIIPETEEIRNTYEYKGVIFPGIYFFSSRHRSVETFFLNNVMVATRTVSGVGKILVDILRVCCQICAEENQNMIPRKTILVTSM